jgi:gliding motility-associated-like protein
MHKGFKILLLPFFYLLSVNAIAQLVCPWQTLPFRPDTLFVCPPEFAGWLNSSWGSCCTNLWDDGSTGEDLRIKHEGWYWVDVTGNGCTVRDSTYAMYVQPPALDLGVDTILCQGRTWKLDAGDPGPGTKYLWRDNSTKSTLYVTRPGTYWVSVQRGCIARDTIKISYAKKPKFSFGADKVICDGQTILLDPNLDAASFRWQDGSSLPIYNVNIPGTYFLEAVNSCGSVSDTIVIKPGTCKLFVPTAFSPNDDGKNEIFRILGYENIIEFNLEIFNRWGQKIFVSKNFNEGWDGKIKGGKQPAGVYAWILQYKIINKSETFRLKGTFVLIR